MRDFIKRWWGQLIATVPITISAILFWSHSNVLRIIGGIILIAEAILSNIGLIGMILSGKNNYYEATAEVLDYFKEEP